MPAWLHGALKIEIIEGDDIPGERIGALGGNAVGRLIEKGFSKAKAAEAYVTLDIKTPYQTSKSRFRSGIVRSHNPKWNETARIDVADYVEMLVFVVKDDDFVGADFIGQVEIPVEKVLSGERLEGTFPMTNKQGAQIDNFSKEAKLKLAVEYIPIEKELQLYKLGASSAVPQVFFPLREGNRVTLYHDAHVIDAGEKPDIPLASGVLYKDLSCWDTLYADILAAKHFVYISGWSVVDDVHLSRDFTKGEQAGPTIGELLKQKADVEDLKVCLLIWDDQSSNSMLGTAGVMMTKDEETKKYFKGSDVECVLCPRKMGGKESLLRSVATTTMFTHHQKLVVMDAPPKDGSSHRQVIAYVGGLDLTTGRYDTPEHYLFKTLETVHKQDFYQGCIAGVDQAKGGPRQPWHDIHSRIEGPAAWDVLENFTQRWDKQAGLTKKFKLLDFKKCPDIYLPNNVNNVHGDPQVFALPKGDPESWSVQLFRSIDSNSVGVFPEDNRKATAQGLQTGKGTTVEASIHRAYVYAIRRAQRFLYIENQYFLGSAQNWPDEKHPGGGADHLIPIEIALKCAAKARTGEPFCAYIIIPAHPEGDPHANSTQEILFWQGQTMRMMYKLVADAIAASGTDAHPLDYLQFFYVGVREPVSPDEVAPATLPAANSAQANHQASRRHMIYVHSKHMIVDDEYTIVGSANINQRSMAGLRDSEIAIGAYQPAFLMGDSQQLPRGQVHGFRMTLWEEHMGKVQPLFLDPGTRECSRAVQQLAKANLNAYLGDEICKLPYGHCCAYPLDIARDGTITNIPGLVDFPDTKASILGKEGGLPDVLTT